MTDRKEIYAITGGPKWIPSDVMFETLDEAWMEWKRRRNDVQNWWPTWGDAGPDAVAVITPHCGMTWTARELANNPLDDLAHYYDEDEISSPIPLYPRKLT